METDPNVHNDLDGNGISDAWELLHFGRTAIDLSGDADSDGVDNWHEYLWGVDPNDRDSDGDGMTDGQELDRGTDPRDANSGIYSLVAWEASVEVTTTTYVAPQYGIKGFMHADSGKRYQKVSYVPIEPRLLGDGSLLVSETWTWDQEMYMWYLVVETTVNSYSGYDFFYRADYISYPNDMNHDSDTQFNGYTLSNAIDNETVVGEPDVYEYAASYPVAYRRDGQRAKSDYRVKVPSGAVGTVRWKEIFAPEDTGIPEVLGTREWVISGTVGPLHTLSAPRLGNSWVEVETSDLILIEARLAVDANRDGEIDETPDGSSDATSAEAPFRFWINDDDDQGPAHGDDIPERPLNKADFNNAVVDSVRDLVDLFPVYLDIKQFLAVLPTTKPGVKYKLKQADGALNFVYTNKTRAQAFDYQRQLLPTGFTDLFDKQPGEATTNRITAEGYELSEAFLKGLNDNDWGVILVEGRAATTSPLVLVVETDGTAVAEVKLEIKISPVEQMFRHVNVTSSATNYNGSTLTLPASAQPTATGEPAGWPDSQTNGKYFVFVHGYNVDGQKARGWNCEVFKRMHVLGSKARFVGVTWHGATGKDYHKAVYQAFQTGDAINAALNFTSGADVTIAAHSLGNMVVSHAIQSGGYSPSRYYMINAAVPIEAYDLSNVDATQRTAMVEDDWKGRDARFYASNWHQLFSGTPADRRNELSWKNRLIRARRDVEAHNFYSPGEDVVENAITDSAGVAVQIWNQGGDFFSGKGAWTAQELVKGVNWTTSLADLFLERGQAGWDSDLAYLFTSHASITNELLKTRPFFDEFIEDDLIDSNPAIASAKAGEAKVQYDLLARGLPSLSYAAAANRVIALDQIDPARNFDMETKGRTSEQWPTEGHSGGNAGKWLHSDFKNAALPYVHQMYEAMIAKGTLK